MSDQKMSDPKPLTALERMRMKHPGPVAAAPVAAAPVAAAPVAAPINALNPALASLLSGAPVAPAPVAPAPVAPEPVAPAPVAPAPVAPVAPAPVAPAPVTLPTEQLTALAPVTRQPLPPLVNALSEEDARSMLLNIFGKPASYGDALNASVEASEDGPMISMKQPFGVVSGGQWSVLKDKYPAPVYDGMPSGDRDYVAIYLGHRLSGTGWAGAPSQVGNKPPLYKYVVPTTEADGVTTNELMLEFNKATLNIGSKVMFTPAPERGKFDLLGRLSPEIHIHVWRPDAGFILLVCKGFKGVRDTVAHLENARMIVGASYLFTIDVDTVFNKKGTLEKKNQEWKAYSILPKKVDADSPYSEKAMHFVRELLDLSRRDPLGMISPINAFNTGSDFEGMAPDVLAEKLDAYSHIIGKDVFKE